MGDGEGLEDAADRLPGLGPREEVEVVGHQAVTEEPEGVARLGGGEGLAEGEVIGLIGEDIAAVVAAIECVVDITRAGGGDRIPGEG
jgi:hypothetical protein